MPTRDSRTGESIAKFAAGFSARRREELPPWAAATAFDHFYRLAVNTSHRPPWGERCTSATPWRLSTDRFAN
ncbi:MAG: hypothetical protein QM775_26620 [Pirellulales bacterium]